jgi:hypothetical protein
MKLQNAILVFAMVACAGLQAAPQAAMKPLPHAALKAPPKAAPPAPSPAAAQSVHAGPLFTTGSSDTREGDTPTFPNVHILLDPADETVVQPAALHLTVDGKDCGTASKVERFGDSGHGVAADFAIDVSGSMRGGPLNAIKAGLTHFADKAGKNDRVSIQTLADDSRTDVKWDDSTNKLRPALQALAARGRLTRLWDGLLDALGKFPDKPATRRLIVISDGHDEGSQHSEEEVIRKALELQIPIDAIGVTRSNPIYLRSLQQLATGTGGHFRSAANEQQLEQFVGSGIERIKSLPLAEFEAKDVKGDGKPHNFLVAWKPAGKEIPWRFSATLPKVDEFWESPWLWIGALAAAALLLVIFLMTQRKKPLPVMPAPSPMAPRPSPAASGPVPTPAPQPTFKPNAPRPFVPPVSPQPAPQASPAPEPAPTPAPNQRPPVNRVRTQISHSFPPPSPQTPTAWLLCEDGFAKGRQFPIHSTEFWIGSLDNNSLCIPGDPTVSGNHACIVFEHGILGIFDHNSTNGTRVNNQTVQETRQLLRPGDRIRIGRSTFVLLSTQAQAAIV